MTWRTNIGDRVLEGIEAEFYLTATQYAIDYLQDAYEFEDEIVKTYDRIFDLASFDQKVVLLHACLSALLRPDVAAPELNNLLEATAYFPFAFLRMRVSEEIEIGQGDWIEEDDPDNLKYFYRRLVWKPFEEYVLPIWQDSDEDEAEAIEFDAHSDDFELWDEAFDGLLDRIFWDRDWMLTWSNPQVLDGIDESISKPLDLEDYFMNRLPKVGSEESAVALAEIQAWQLSDDQKN